MTTKKPKKPQTFRLWLPDGPIVKHPTSVCYTDEAICPTGCGPWCIEEYGGNLFMRCPILPLEV